MELNGAAFLRRILAYEAGDRLVDDLGVGHRAHVPDPLELDDLHLGKRPDQKLSDGTGGSGRVGSHHVQDRDIQSAEHLERCGLLKRARRPTRAGA